MFSYCKPFLWSILYACPKAKSVTKFVRVPTRLCVYRTGVITQPAVAPSDEVKDTKEKTRSFLTPDSQPPPWPIYPLSSPASCPHLFIPFTNIPFPSTDGIAAATLGSILNYLLLGFAPQLDRFYLHSFEILQACAVVFTGVGNLGYTLLEYRLGHRSFFSSLFENLRWVPFL